MNIFKLLLKAVSRWCIVIRITRTLTNAISIVDVEQPLQEVTLKHKLNYTLWDTIFVRLTKREVQQVLDESDSFQVLKGFRSLTVFTLSLQPICKQWSMKMHRSIKQQDIVTQRRGDTVTIDGWLIERFTFKSKYVQIVPVQWHLSIMRLWCGANPWDEPGIRFFGKHQYVGTGKS